MHRLTLDTSDAESELNSVGVLIPTLALATIAKGILDLSGIASEINEIEEQNLYSVSFESRHQGGLATLRTLEEVLDLLRERFDDEDAEKAELAILGGEESASSHYGLGFSWEVRACYLKSENEQPDPIIDKSKILAALSKSYPDQSQPIEYLATSGDSLASFLVNELAGEDTTRSEAIRLAEQAATDVLTVAMALRKMAP